MSFFAPGSLPSNIGFGITGAFAAAYLVPLNAHLQDNCDPSNRSTVIAAGNLMDCLMGLVAVGFQLMLRNIFSIQNQFWVLAALGVVITIVAFRLIPREFIRMMGLWIMRIVYRSRIIHQDRIPEDGGAVIVSNHVTYGDALFLSLICPRPIRFIVAEEFVAIRWLGWILELFNCLPISSRNPRESLSKAIQALKSGEVICIFPEGQLTRTGTLCAARRGLEMLAKNRAAPSCPFTWTNYGAASSPTQATVSSPKRLSAFPTVSPPPSESPLSLMPSIPAWSSTRCGSYPPHAWKLQPASAGMPS